MVEPCQQVSRPTGPTRLFGESRAEKWVATVVALPCFGDAVWATKGDIRAPIRDGAFHSCLLFAVVFYLLEMCYRFLPDVRSD